MSHDKSQLNYVCVYMNDISRHCKVTGILMKAPNEYSTCRSQRSLIGHSVKLLVDSQLNWTQPKFPRHNCSHESAINYFIQHCVVRPVRQLIVRVNFIVRFVIIWLYENIWRYMYSAFCMKKFKVCIMSALLIFTTDMWLILSQWYKILYQK